MDIDIDIPSNVDREKLLPLATRASMVQHGTLVPHPCGMYLQNMPRDPITGLACIPYDQADEYGYTKIDFLHLHILNQFESKDHIKRLLQIAPDWSLLRQRDVVERLFQINNHFDVVYNIRPHDIMSLADCIAIIRPGRSELLPEYINSPDKTEVRRKLYTVSSADKYSYKKGHAISYAMVIVLQLHLIGHTDVIE